MKHGNPQSLQEGKRYLSQLREETCPNFRVYAGSIREAVRKMKYTYEELGTTQVEVIELALKHAGDATLRVSRYPLVDLLVKNTLACELAAAKGAHRMPEDGDTIFLQEKRNVFAT